MNPFIEQQISEAIRRNLQTIKIKPDAATVHVNVEEPMIKHTNCNERKEKKETKIKITLND